MSDGKKLAAELTRLRQAAGLTYEEAACRTQRVRARGALPVSSSSIIALEIGTANPSVRFLRALAHVYRVTTWHLLELAGYVTDQDALDGVEAMKARSRRRAA